MQEVDEDLDPIPLVDLGLQHEAVEEEILGGIAAVGRRSAFTLGQEVAEFEIAFATFCGVSHCVGVSSGTDALELAIRAFGFTEGQEVLLPANSFVASAAAVVRAGATPVLVDIDHDTLLLSLGAVSSRISDKSRAIMPVHLYGQMAPMDEVLKVAADANLTILEDAAQAHGATQNGRPAGSFGLAGAFSFYPGKNLGAYGDAGAVTTNSAQLAEAIASMRNHGSLKKHIHEHLGFTCRMDTVQAVVLLAKLKRLERWNQERKVAAQFYDENLTDVDEVVRPKVLPGNNHAWHLYVVRVPRRDQVAHRLSGTGIGIGIHYPVPIHLHKSFRFLKHQPGDFPCAEKTANEILSLPLYPGITRQQQKRVVGELTKALMRKV